MKNTSAYKIKLTAIFALLLVESTALSVQLVNYVMVGDLFPPLIVFLKIALIMLLLAYTYSMTVGAWKGWEQYILGPVPTSFGILLTLSLVNPVHARNIGVLSGLLVLYFTLKALSLGTAFVSFSPSHILRGSIKGLFFVFSLVCASAVFVNTGNKGVLNLQESMTDAIVKQVESLALGDISTKDIVGASGINANIKEQLQEQIDKTIEPYKGAVAPLMALVIFSILHTVSAITLLIYSLTIDWVFWVAKKLKLIKIEYVSVQQERPTF